MKELVPEPWTSTNVGDDELLKVDRLPAITPEAAMEVLEPVIALLQDLPKQDRRAFAASTAFTTRPLPSSPEALVLPGQVAAGPAADR
ncbi:hypothetical protein [Nonomuraea cavernae]|uniref:Uncharacterized protein n=1 Tax=Nonomuraea cavernae TaxID=2045107 RepID=A0A917YWQ9_9ACTN|nr:hypothetical protein [Nonomuraea cavernae]MCA2187507.1 hypothetical protein [Nonomuraea cavernae]GGO68832.1 hypothetical protein GCM10012289_28530 [Nonomuraea cavernae]